MTKDLFLVRGLPGAGKTTFARSLAREGDLIIAADDFMADEKGDYAFDWKRLEEVHKKCRDSVEDAMRRGVERIFVHNTMKEESELKPYYDLAAKNAYRVFSLILENRHGGKSEQGVPEGTVENMRRKFDIKP